MSMLLRRYHDRQEAKPKETIEVPGGNASKDAWHAYALAQGKSAEDLDGLTRDQLRDLFKDPAGEDGKKASEPFDPATHTVEEVRAYLDGLDDSDPEARDAEFARVAEAEKAGPNRSTLLEGIEGVPADNPTE